MLKVQRSTETLITPRSVVARPILAPVPPAIPQRALLDETHVAEQEHLPLAETRNGNWFKDRFDSNLIWYVPSFALVDDPDAAFTFAASQTGEIDVHGNPYNVGRLTLGLKKSIPADVLALRTQIASAQLREVPLNNLSVSLSATAKDANGGDQPLAWPCAVAPSGDSLLLLTINPILSEQVIFLYESLVHQESVRLSISAAYTVWRQLRRFLGPHRVFVRPRPMIMIMMARPDIAGNRRFVDVDPPDLQDRAATDQGEQSAPDPYARVSLPFTLVVPVARKFAADPYRLKFTVATGGGVSRPIIGVQDLQTFKGSQTQFTELKLLGNVSERYPSIARLYLGILSSTIVVIPARYVILRQSSSCAAVCQALVDSSPGLNAGCKFQFEFTLVPDVSPIDLLQLAQDISAHPDPETKGCTLRLPDFLKNDVPSTLETPFVTSFRYTQGPGEPHTFLLSVDIKEVAAGIPAVANANMLIDQLRSAHEPFLSGALAIKLDDGFPTPIAIPVLLNFKETNGTEGLSFLADESSKVVTLTNNSVFDLTLSRSALVTPQSMTVMEIGKGLPSGQALSLPLPADHAGLNVIVDAELAITDSLSKTDLFKYLQFNPVDVQNTQYTLGVNGATLNFDVRGIDHIDVQISLTNLPNITVPLFTLHKLRKLDSATILLPLNHAISELSATLSCTLHFVDATRASGTCTLQNDFVHTPIFMLKDADVPA